MPISFIAVQCFECSTMQVKQQKKSSNKWSCVVCNQKQSVRKVFAQSFMAKDVRIFVQSFNMSRQLSDHNQSFANDELDITDSSKIGEPKRKRNDWAEYIDDEQEDFIGRFEKKSNCVQGDEVEPVIVTEMPQAMFAKPKMKGYSRGEKLLKPSFPNRRDKNLIDTPCSERAEDTSSQALKLNSLIAQIREENKPTRVINSGNYSSNAGQKVSKWSSFITEDDGDNATADDSFESRGSREDHSLKLSTPMNDEIIEEEIHPDFL